MSKMSLHKSGTWAESTSYSLKGILVDKESSPNSLYSYILNDPKAIAFFIIFGSDLNVYFNTDYHYVPFERHSFKISNA